MITKQPRQLAALEIAADVRSLVRAVNITCEHQSNTVRAAYKASANLTIGSLLAQLEALRADLTKPLPSIEEMRGIFNRKDSQ